MLHGDLNTSNFFYSDTTHGLSVFDWDQAQQGWIIILQLYSISNCEAGFYLMDVAQASQGVRMLAEGGSLIDGSDVPGVNPERLLEWMVS